MSKTKQEIFNEAYSGLESQNFQQSIKHNKYGNHCLYRHGDLKCAIGYCIPDSDYLVEFEHRSVEANEVLNAAGINLSLSNFAAELQACHDNALDVDDMICRLKRFAKKHELEVPSA